MINRVQGYTIQPIAPIRNVNIINKETETNFNIPENIKEIFKSYNINQEEIDIYVNNISKTIYDIKVETFDKLILDVSNYTYSTEQEQEQELFNIIPSKILPIITMIKSDSNVFIGNEFDENYETNEHGERNNVINAFNKLLTERNYDFKDDNNNPKVMPKKTIFNNNKEQILKTLKYLRLLKNYREGKGDMVVFLSMCKTRFKELKTTIYDLNTFMDSFEKIKDKNEKVFDTLTVIGSDFNDLKLPLIIENYNIKMEANVMINNIRKLYSGFLEKYYMKTHKIIDNMKLILTEYTFLKNILDSIHSTIEFKTPVCEICYLQPKDSILSCGHTFCNKCITDESINSKCPICREKFDKINKIIM